MNIGRENDIKESKELNMKFKHIYKKIGYNYGYCRTCLYSDEYIQNCKLHNINISSMYDSTCKTFRRNNETIRWCINNYRNINRESIIKRKIGFHDFEF